MGYGVLPGDVILYRKKAQIMQQNGGRKMDLFKLKNLGIFAGGVLFGTAGIKVLSSREAKKAYTSCTAAVLRAKDCVMKTAETVQENAEDILAEARQINEKRAAECEAAVEEDLDESAKECETAESSCEEAGEA